MFPHYCWANHFPVFWVVNSCFIFMGIFYYICICFCNQLKQMHGLYDLETFWPSNMKLESKYTDSESDNPTFSDSLIKDRVGFPQFLGLNCKSWNGTSSKVLDLNCIDLLGWASLLRNTYWLYTNINITSINDPIIIIIIIKILDLIISN